MAAAALVIATSAAPLAAQNVERPPVVRDAPRRTGALILNRFIVTVEPRSDPGSVASAAGVRAEHVYRNVLNGFAVTASELI